MTAELLLDAIGMIDDSFLFEEASPRRISLRRTAIVFIAAILAALLTFMTAIAVSPEFKEFVYSFVNMKTQENLPIPDLKVDKIFTIQTMESTPVPDPQETLPAEGPMKEQGYQQIDGMVKAKYFTTNGLFQLFDDVIYTCDRNDEYSNPIFWEVTSDGLTPHQATRVEFSLWYGWKRHKIFFDYAVINGRLYEQEWPPDLDRDPYGNGWKCSSVTNRTDVVLLHIPAKKKRTATITPLLLDLKTKKVTNLFSNLPLDDIYIDVVWLSDDMNQAVFAGYKKFLNAQGENKYFDGTWICDLNNDTMSCVEEITGISGYRGYWQYVNENTLENCIIDPDTNCYTLYRYDIPTRECVKVLDNVHAKKIFTHFAVVQNEDFSYWLWDLRTGERRKLDGLYLAGMIAYESPNKNNIVFTSRWKNPEIDQWSECYPKIGMLNTETGAFQILKRDVKGKLSEYLYGWLNDTTVVTAAHDGVSGFYIYIYEFTALQS